MKVGELVHLPNATQSGPLCGKISALALTCECTMEVGLLTCVHCVTALLQINTQANAALSQRLGFLLEERLDVFGKQLSGKK